MIEQFAPLLEAIQRNCHIADARYAREMTLCTYLLEMREFYRWEHDLPAGVSPPRDDVGRWISEREALWEDLAEADFAPLPLGGQPHDPFAVAAVNAALLPRGLVYGAGIGRFHKPHFFLGRLERLERHDDLAVVVSGCEYARDMTAIPAALQAGTIIIRRESLRQWLAQKVEAWGMKKKPGPMASALAAYGADLDPAAVLSAMTDAETETLILHERGEHAAGRLLGQGWEVMIVGFGDRRAELVARAVRDNLADCLSTLPILIERQAWGSLHFWFANFDGLRRELFPALLPAYERFADGHDVTALAATAAAGARHWQGVAARLLALANQAEGRGETAIGAFAGTPEPLALASC